MHLDTLERRIALLSRLVKLAVELVKINPDMPKSMQRYNLYHTIVVGDWRQRLIARLVYWFWL